ncbi:MULTISPECIES: spore coat protein [Paenibacillus]|uniref:spore coat protein n=1 Tax=Paenibacillus TaxID=44249 RepID=UPI0008389A87|nr:MULTISPECIES: spore coat protein [Paenibacillus]GIP22791.1 spore coat protein F-like protein YhcQ [Paenibacillus sp. J22TS3]
MQQQTGSQQNQAIPGFNHGGHEIFEAQEIIQCTINILDNYTIYKQFVKDPDLMDILNRQAGYIETQYNLTVECFKSGQKPSQVTEPYLIPDMKEQVYGLKPGQPKKPAASQAEIDDAAISTLMLNQIKPHASGLARSATEVTNPVLRRVLASQSQNFVEMAYELYQYQNVRGYYQVPQLSGQDLHTLLNGFAPSSGINQGSAGMGRTH